MKGRHSTELKITFFFLLQLFPHSFYGLRHDTVNQPLHPSASLLPSVKGRLLLLELPKELKHKLDPISLRGSQVPWERQYKFRESKPMIHHCTWGFVFVKFWLNKYKKQISNLSQLTNLLLYFEINWSCTELGVSYWVRCDGNCWLPLGGGAVLRLSPGDWSWRLMWPPTLGEARIIILTFVNEEALDRSC